MFNFFFNNKIFFDSNKNSSLIIISGIAQILDPMTIDPQAAAS